MKKLSDIKDVLYNYVREYIELEQEEDSLSWKYSLCDDILNNLYKCMENDYEDVVGLRICLETLFGNRYEELLNCVFASKKMFLINKEDDVLNAKIVSFINDIKLESEKIKERRMDVKDKLLDSKEKMITSRRVLTSLKYFQVISKDDIKNVGELLREGNFSSAEVSFAVEKLFIRNKNIKSEQTGIKFQDKYKFIKLLTMGYETFESPDVFNVDKLMGISNVVINLLEHNDEEVDKEEIMKILPVIGSDVNDINELEFVLIKVLENIRDKMIDTVDMIRDEDFVVDLNAKNQLSVECYSLITYYNLIRNYMDSEIGKYIVEEPVLNEQINEQSDAIVNNLHYLKSENGNCYLISDIEKMPLEYLGKVSELLDEFKKNSLSKKKNKRLVENANARGFQELKDDQIRIVYKKIQDNDYLVYGAFVKKDDRKYRRQFDSTIARTGVVCEDSFVIEEQLQQYIDVNARKWSR